MSIIYKIPMGTGASSYKIKELTVDQLSLRLLEVYSTLNNQTLELKMANARIHTLENDNRTHKKKQNCLACLRYIRECNIINTAEGKDFFLTFALHTLTQTVRFPELCEAQIHFFNMKICVETPNYAQSFWPMEIQLFCPTDGENQAIGRITLKYNSSKMIETNDPWTKEEECFISSACSLIVLKIYCDDKKQLLEQTRSQRELLDDILPHEIVNTILETGQPPSPRNYMCTILFTDIVGFTNLCS